MPPSLREALQTVLKLKKIKKYNLCIACNASLCEGGKAASSHIFKLKINKKIIKMRALSYKIQTEKEGNQFEEDYYIATHDLCRHNVNYYRDLYWKRWNVETNFRYLKSQLNLNLLTSQNILHIQQDIKIIHFITLLSEYITELQKKIINNDNKKINNEMSIQTAATKLIPAVCDNDTFFFDKFLNIIIKLCSFSNNKRENRSYPRVCKRPYPKWTKRGKKFKA
jgi:hypothetical protein